MNTRGFIPGSDNVKKFTDNTTPAMKSWDGQSFNRSITAISKLNENIEFDFMFLEDGSPIDFEATPIDHLSIQLNWTPSSENYPILIACSTDSIFGNPEDGKIYSNGETISGGGTVLYYGNNMDNMAHNALDSSTKYYYAAWSEKSGV
jgi:hypothetical protein